MTNTHERLQKARERAGFPTATAAAVAFDWPVSTYLGHENGSRGLRKDAVWRYAHAFGVSWAWLYGAENDLEESAELLAGIRVEGFIDNGAFKRAPVLGEESEVLYLQVFGYKSTELAAFKITHATDHHYIVSTSNSHTLLLGDELVIKRATESGPEFSAWRLEKRREKTILVSAYTQLSDTTTEPLEMLDDGNCEILGTVVAEVRIRRRVEYFKEE